MNLKYSTIVTRISFFWFLSCLLAATGLHAQQSGFLPSAMEEAINSSYAEINPILSPDGNTIYFQRLEHPENRFGTHETQDIWYSDKQPDGTWAEAKRLPDKVNFARKNALVNVLDDGTLIVTGTARNNGEWKKRGLSKVIRNGDDFSSPQKINIAAYSRVNRGNVSNAYMANNGTSIVFAYTKRWNKSKLDLYYSLKEGNKYSKPKKIGKNVISEKSSSEEAPFMDDETKTLYYTKVSRKDKGNADIYQVERLDNSWKNWSPPVKLSDTINSDKWDSYYRTNRSGSFAYFASQRDGSNPDIFRVKVFEEKPFIYVRGRVLNLKDGLPLDVKYGTVMLLDGEENDSLHFDTEASSFYVRLPFRKSYSLKPEIEKFNTYSETIDLTETLEHDTITIDFMVGAVPFVDVTGRLLFQGIDSPLPADCRPKILVNDKELDSLELDVTHAVYSLRIAHGANYKLKIANDTYEPVEAVLDLWKTDMYKKINLDLYVKPLPYVKVTGRVVERPGNAPVPESAAVKVVINDAAPEALKYDASTGEYSMQVAHGKSHIIKALANGYETIPVTLDLSGINNYGEYVKNLAVEKEKAPSATVTGTIYNKKDGKPVIGTNIEMSVNGTAQLHADVNTNNGTYLIELPLGTDYLLSANSPDFYSTAEQIALAKEKEKVKIIKDIYLNPIEVGASIKIENIFFDFGKASLREESFPELNRLVAFLKENPNVKIEVAGHTDNVGKADKNQIISEYRAKAVAHYLNNNGIDPERTTYKGYGLNKPVATNSTAEGRALNRRVEFTILSK